MRYKALISFTGLETMAKGEVKEILNPSIAKDLLQAGYIEKVDEEIKEVKKAVRKRTVKK